MSTDPMPCATRDPNSDLLVGQSPRDIVFYLNDSQLIEACLAGDERAWEA